MLTLISIINLKTSRKCDFTGKDPGYLKKHEKSNNEDYLTKCKKCEYSTHDISNLKRHNNGKHIDQNIRCEDCCQIFADNLNLKRLENAKHTLKSCNECEFTTFPNAELNKHKKLKHEPDDYQEESAFNKTLYKKSWNIQGFKDSLTTLFKYKAKVWITISYLYYSIWE